MDIKYVVDFDPKLGEIIAETKYMEMLGYSVPELARNVALQVCCFANVCFLLALSSSCLVFSLPFCHSLSSFICLLSV